MLEGELDPALFRQAWLMLIEHYDVLRTTFVRLKEKLPLQVVSRAAQLPLEEADWQGLSDAGREARLVELMQTERGRDFDFAKAPLMRMGLYRLGEHSHQFLWTMHHSVIDGWSLPIVFQKFIQVYQHLADGKPWQWPANPEYRDYIAWLQQQDKATGG